MVRLASQEASGILLSLLPQLWGYRHAGFFIDAGDPSSSPHVCDAGTSPSEPSL